MEFIYAPNGIIGLETAWPVSVRRLLQSEVLDLETLLEKLVVNPRNILGLDIPKIEEGADDNLTLFDTDEEWTYTEERVKSKSANSPDLGSQLTGRAEAIYNRGQLVVNEL